MILVNLGAGSMTLHPQLWTRPKLSPATYVTRMPSVIPTIVTQLAAHDPRQGPAAIRLSATASTRDFTYVSDTVDGFIAAARTDGAVGEVVNLGTNFEISVGETAQTIADLIGWQPAHAGWEGFRRGLAETSAGLPHRPIGPATRPISTTSDPILRVPLTASMDR
jgi:nucleoside-diphosphate-sugar epimerase